MQTQTMTDAKRRGKGRPPKDPETALERWFSETGTSYAEFASKLGWSEGYLKRVAAKQVRVDRVAALALEYLTQCAVKVEDLLTETTEKS